VKRNNIFWLYQLHEIDLQVVVRVRERACWSLFHKIRLCLETKWMRAITCFENKWSSMTRGDTWHVDDTWWHRESWNAEIAAGQSMMHTIEFPSATQPTRFVSITSLITVISMRSLHRTAVKLLLSSPKKSILELFFDGSDRIYLTYQKTVFEWINVFFQPYSASSPGYLKRKRWLMNFWDTLVLPSFRRYLRVSLSACPALKGNGRCVTCNPGSKPSTSSSCIPPILP